MFVRETRYRDRVVNPWDLAFDCAAAYRITRLITSDKVLLPLRARVIRYSYSKTLGQVAEPWSSLRDEDWEQQVLDDDYAPKLATLITCRFCVGVYAGVAVCIARRYLPGWPHMARALTVASAATLISGLERE